MAINPDEYLKALQSYTPTSLRNDNLYKTPDIIPNDDTSYKVTSDSGRYTPPSFVDDFSNSIGSTYNDIVDTVSNASVDSFVKMFEDSISSVGNAFMSGVARTNMGMLNLPRMIQKGGSEIMGAVLPKSIYDPAKDPILNTLNKGINYYDGLANEDQKRSDELAGNNPALKFVNMGIGAIPQVLTAGVMGAGLAGKMATKGLTAMEGAFAPTLGANIAETVTPMLPFGSIASGQYAREAENDGANYVQQVLYGLAGGTAETATELIPFKSAKGLLKGLKNKSLINEGAKNFLSKYGKAGSKYLATVLQESAQEAAVDPITGMIKKGTYDPKTPWAGKDGVFDPKQMMEDAAGGASMAIILSALGLPTHMKSRRMTEKLIDSGKNITSEDVADIEEEVKIDDHKLAQGTFTVKNVDLADAEKSYEENRQKVVEYYGNEDVKRAIDEADSKKATGGIEALYNRETETGQKMSKTQVKKVIQGGEKLSENDYKIVEAYFPDLVDKYDLTDPTKPLDINNRILKDTGIDMISLADNLERAKKPNVENIAGKQRLAYVSGVDERPVNKPYFEKPQVQTEGIQEAQPTVEQTVQEPEVFKPYNAKLVSSNETVRVTKDDGSYITYRDNISGMAHKVRKSTFLKITGQEAVSSGEAKQQSNNNVSSTVNGTNKSKSDSGKNKGKTAKTGGNYKYNTKEQVEKVFKSASNETNRKNKSGFKYELSEAETKDEKDLQKMMHELGIDVAYFKTDSTFESEFVSPKNGSVIFMKKGSTRDMLGLTGHGFLHTVRINHPDLYKQLKEVVGDTIDNSKVKEYRDALKKDNDNENDLDAKDVLNAYADNLSRDKVVEEMMADESVTLFTDKNFWQEVYNKDKPLFERLVKIAFDMFKKIKQIFQDSKLNREQADIYRAEFGKIVKEIRERTSKGVTGIDRQSSKAVNSASEEVSYSIRLHEKLFEKAEAQNEKNEGKLKLSAKGMKKAKKAMAETKKILEMITDILPPDNDGNIIQNNGSYAKSIDNSTQCVRTFALYDLLDKVADRMERPLTQDEAFAISQGLFNYTDKPGCLYCYVEAGRRKFHEALGSYIEDRDKVESLYKQGLPANQIYEKYLNGRKKTNETDKRFPRWINEIMNNKPRITAKDLASEISMQEASKDKALEAQVKDAVRYAFSASRGKAKLSYLAYNGNILNLKPSIVKTLNMNEGLRWYSYSDFTPTYILENMQTVLDAAVKGLRGLAYTKETAFVEIFARTGMSINMSVFIHEANGEFTSDGMQGIDWDEAKKLRDKYPGVGTMMVVTNDRQLKWALEQDWVDMVIPFHLSQLKKDIANRMGWINYTAGQEEKAIKDQFEGGSKTIYPIEHKNDKETYLKLTSERGLTPKFANISWLIEHPNYMKVVKEGAGRKPMEVAPTLKPIFDMEAVKDTLADYVKRGGDSSKIDQQIVDDMVDMIQGRKVGFGSMDELSEQFVTSYSSRGIKERTDTPEFKKWFGDSKVVDEDGNPLVVWHGTDKEFTEFTTKNQWGYSGAYFSSSENVAKAYTRNGKIVPAYVSLQNPLIVDAQAKRYDSIPKLKGMKVRWDTVDTQEIVAFARDSGKYDGVIVINVMENGGVGDDIIAFEPTQIKSINNTGTFDPNNPDIRYSARGIAEREDKNTVEVTNKTEYVSSNWDNQPVIKGKFYRGQDEDGRKRFNRSMWSRFGDGNYYANLRKVAEIYGEARENPVIIEKDITLEKPFVNYIIDRTSPEFKKMSELLKENGLTDNQIRFSFNIENSNDRRLPFERLVSKLDRNKVNSILREAGYDGIISEYTNDPDFPNHIEVVTFDDTSYSARGIRERGQQIKDVAVNAKDISGLKAYGTDIYRIFRDVFGQDFKWAKSKYLDTLDMAKKNYVDDQEKLINELKKNVIDKGIKKDSKLSRLVQQYGEKKITLDELKTKTNKWQDVVSSTDWFKNKYKELLAEINAVRARIYPNNPDKIIPERRDYFRHFTEIAEGIDGLRNLFDTPANIDPQLVGTSEYTKPKSKWESIFQERKGDKTKIDAVGGFLNYIPAASYSINIDPMIGMFEGLEKDLKDATNESRHLNNFIQLLDDYSKDLAGKTNPMFDREVQKLIGRRGMRVISWFNGRIKGNMILGNVSSMVSQIANVPNGIAKVKNPIYLTEGIFDTLKAMAHTNPAVKESGFLKERYMDKMYRQFDSKLLDQPKKFLTWLMEGSDFVGTNFVWNSLYRKAQNMKNIDDPIKYADDETRKLVAGRGIGEVPLLQKSKVFQMAAPFQLEVANLWNVQKDFIKDKDFGGLILLWLLLRAFNYGMEELKGSGITFDPIKAVWDITGSDKAKDMTNIQKAGRLAGEVLGNVPGGNNIAASLMDEKQRKDFFGKEDPTRFGTGIITSKGLQDPLYKVLPPYGGGQVKKTIEGLEAKNKGGVYTKYGQLQYPVDKNDLRLGVFGKSSVKQASEYYDNEAKPLSEKQTATYKKQVSRGNSFEDAYKKILKEREINSIELKIKDIDDDNKLSRSDKTAQKLKLNQRLSKLKLAK